MFVRSLDSATGLAMVKANDVVESKLRVDVCSRLVLPMVEGLPVSGCAAFWSPRIAAVAPLQC